VKTFIAPPGFIGIASRGLGIAPIGQLGRARLFPGDAP